MGPGAKSPLSVEVCARCNCPQHSPLPTHTCSGHSVSGTSHSLLLADTHTHTAIDCGPLDEPSDGYITYSESTALGSVAQYSCDFGYTLEPSLAPPFRTCTSSGEWDSIARSCTRKGSNHTHSSMRGQQHGRQSIKHQHTPISHTPPLHTLLSLYCTYCHTAFDCGLLPDPLNGTVDTSRGTTYKSLAVYTCDEGYELFGEPVRTCGAFAWNGSEPSCISKPELAYRGYTMEYGLGVRNTQCSTDCVSLLPPPL